MNYHIKIGDKVRFKWKGYMLRGFVESRTYTFNPEGYKDKARVITGKAKTTAIVIEVDKLMRVYK